jgi:superfamily II DNA or RNA helicase
MVDDKLRPYQVEALRELDARFQDRRRLLLSLPTGAGKTRVAVVHCRDRFVSQGRRVLWIAHSEELLDQAYTTFLSMGVDESRLARRYARHDELRTRSDAQVFFINNRVQHGPAGELDLIVVDEAHHAAAETYRQWLQTYKAARDDGPRVLGLTATPYRLHEGEVTDLCQFSFSRPKIRIFEEIAYRKSFCELAAEGFVAPFRHITFETGMRFDMKLNSTRDDFAGASLAELDTKERNQFIVDHWRGRPDFGKTLIFVGTQEHAKRLAKLFGEVAGFVVAGDPKRDETLARFRSGAIQVLINVAILKEGVDVPDIRTIFLARPTLSPILFTQMVGRGSRLLQDKRYFHLVDIHDQLGSYEHYLAGVEDLADRRHELIKAIEERGEARDAIDRMSVKRLAQDPGVLLDMLAAKQIDFAGWIVFETAAGEARPVGALLSTDEVGVLEPLRGSDNRVAPAATEALAKSASISKSLAKSVEALREGLYGRVFRLTQSQVVEVKALQAQAPIALGLAPSEIAVVQGFMEVLRERASSWGVPPSIVGQVVDEFVRSPRSYEGVFKLRGEQGNFVVLLNKGALNVCAAAVEQRLRGTLGFADGPRILDDLRLADPSLEARGRLVLDAIERAESLDDVCIRHLPL